MSPTWETTADWDGAQSETGVHHEQPTGTDWSASDLLEKGYPSTGPSATAATIYCPFEEDSGTTANDVSGNGNDGTITGAGPAGTGTVTGPFGRTAYTFDGADDLVDHTLDIDAWTQLSVMVWVKAVSTSLSGNEGIVTWGEDASYGEITLNVNSPGGRPQWRVTDGVDTVYSVGASDPGEEIDDDAWHLITATAEENNQLAIHVDDTGTPNTTSYPETMGDPSSTLNVGNWVRTGDKINADISDVLIINGIVSQTEHENAYLAAL